MSGGQGMVKFEAQRGLYYDLPWISRDGTLAGWRFGPPESGGDGPVGEPGHQCRR